MADPHIRTLREDDAFINYLRNLRPLLAIADKERLLWMFTTTKELELANANFWCGPAHNAIVLNGLADPIALLSPNGNPQTGVKYAAQAVHAAKEFTDSFSSFVFMGSAKAVAVMMILLNKHLLLRGMQGKKTSFDARFIYNDLPK